MAAVNAYDYGTQVDLVFLPTYQVAKIRVSAGPYEVALGATPGPSLSCTWEMLAGSAPPWRIRGTFSEAVRYHALLIAPSTYKITPPAGKRTPNVLAVEVDDIDEPTQVTLTIDEPFVGGAYTVEILAVEPPEEEP